jgi:hypothetical protein
MWKQPIHPFRKVEEKMMSGIKPDGETAMPQSAGGFFRQFRF